MTSIHHRTCNLCEAMCGLVIEHEHGEVKSIRGDDADVLSRGHICPKAVALKDVHEDPDRLRAPQRRTAAGFSDCDWDSALDDCAGRLVEVQRRYGRNAVGVYIGNPTAHNFGSLLFGIGLIKTLGTFNRYSATSADQLPFMLAALEMFGHQLLMPVPDIDRTDYLIIIGGNPMVSNGHIMGAPGFKRRVQQLKRRGGRFILIDPRRTETAAIADEHHYIRPGSDALLLAAMLQTLFAEGAIDLGRLAPFTDGVEKLESVVAPFTPEAVAPVCGIAPEVMRQLARDLASTERAVCQGSFGVCTQRFGGLSAWLVNALNIVTGNLDDTGGFMFTHPAVDLLSLASLLGEKGHFDKGRSRVSKLPEFGGEYPVVALAEEIDTPGDGQIRALITIAGNPVLSTPNGARLARALPKLDFMVSLDLYRTETTRHADYILPPVSQLEQSHYDLALHAYAVRNTAKFSPPLFEPSSDAKCDWQIQLELGTRIAQKRGGAGALIAKAARGALGKLGPDGILDQLLRWGPYGARIGGRGLSLAALLGAPHGVDLGPMRPSFPERLGTSDKRIRLVPEVFAADVTRLAAELTSPPAASGELLLIGRRQLRTNNSWLHNSHRMVKGRDRCTLLMHTEDAQARGLEHGQRVAVRSRTGSVEAPLQVTENIMPGVVSLPHGFGHEHRDGMRLGIASRHAGVSINDVTDERAMDQLSCTAAFSGTPVTVAVAEGSAAGEGSASAAQ